MLVILTAVFIIVEAPTVSSKFVSEDYLLRLTSLLFSSLFLTHLLDLGPINIYCSSSSMSYLARTLPPIRTVTRSLPSRSVTAFHTSSTCKSLSEADRGMLLIGSPTSLSKPKCQANISACLSHFHHALFLTPSGRRCPFALLTPSTMSSPPPELTQSYHC